MGNSFCTLAKDSKEDQGLDTYKDSMGDQEVGSTQQQPTNERPLFFMGMCIVIWNVHVAT